MRYCTIGELDEDLAGMPEAFLEEKLPPALVRDVCARRSLSQRAESAFKSWIMACRRSQQWGLESDRTTEAHGCQIAVAGDVVALDDLTSLRVLSSVNKCCNLQRRRSTGVCDTAAGMQWQLYCRKHNGWRRGSSSTHLIVTWPHQGVVAKVAADVGRNNFSVDAIARDEVLVLTGGRRRHGSALVAGLSRHDDRFARA